MHKIALTAAVIASALFAAIPAHADDDYQVDSNNSNSTTIIKTNTTNNNTVINNRYGRRDYGRTYGRHNNRPYYYGYDYHQPSNQIQFRVPVRLNVFGSNIDLDINSGGYGYYNR